MLGKVAKDGKIRCPCCGNYTIEDTSDEVIVDVCPVCFWQYDVIGQENPMVSIGPNRVSLCQARENYLSIGAIEERFLEYVRKPCEDEVPINNC